MEIDKYSNLSWAETSTIQWLCLKPYSLYEWTALFLHIDGLATSHKWFRSKISKKMWTAFPTLHNVSATNKNQPDHINGLVRWRLIRLNLHKYTQYRQTTYNCFQKEIRTGSNVILPGKALNFSTSTYFVYPQQARASIVRRWHKLKCICTHNPPVYTLM